MTEIIFTPHQRFRINQPTVVFQTIEDEVIAIHMESGVYYSFKNTAAEIWNTIASGASFSEILSFFAEKYQADNDKIQSEITHHLLKLKEEKLISPANLSGPLTALKRGAVNGKQLFQPPVMEKFEDMKEHIMADPIHEVDESGWPRRRQNDAGDRQ